MTKPHTILATGATSGIGRVLCSELAERGHRLIAVGRDPDRLAALVHEIPGITTIRMDLTDFNIYPASFGSGEQVDGVVCSAGIYTSTLARFFSPSTHENLMRINLTSPLAVIGELQKAKRLNRGSSIVLVSSILGPVLGLAGSISYAASKAALVGATKSLALELARQEIRVNCVSPGMVDTEMTKGLGYMSPEAHEVVKASYPLGHRYASPREVTACIRFLLSAESSFITGTNLVVDGGCSVQ